MKNERCDTLSSLPIILMSKLPAVLRGWWLSVQTLLYQPGKRNFNWIKLKRHEEGHLTDTLDAVVLGYYAGRGKRAAFGIGAFLVGVYSPKHDRFESVAKIGTGLTDEEWIELKKRCDKEAVQERPHNGVRALSIKTGCLGKSINSCYCASR